jgi:hypothetical protein
VAPQIQMCGSPADFLEVYRGDLALNVKFHGKLDISEKTLKKLATEIPSERQRARILQYAEEALREVWWSTMQDRADELGLGHLNSSGRSGGWLIFDMSYAYLRDLIEDAEKHCKFCDLHYQQHVDGKCPFSSTVFESTEKGPFETWESFRAFSAEVKESLTSVGAGFEDEVLFQLENLDEDGASGVSTPGGSSPSFSESGETPEEEEGVSEQ